MFTVLGIIILSAYRQAQERRRAAEPDAPPPPPPPIELIPLGPLGGGVAFRAHPPTVHFRRRQERAVDVGEEGDADNAGTSGRSGPSEPMNPEPEPEPEPEPDAKEERAEAEEESREASGSTSLISDRRVDGSPRTSAADKGSSTNAFGKRKKLKTAVSLKFASLSFASVCRFGKLGVGRSSGLEPIGQPPPLHIVSN